VIKTKMKTFLGVETMDGNKKDLIGRPVLAAGVKGEQASFLNIEDFKTLQERERLNAKKDIKGQRDLFGGAK